MSVSVFLCVWECVGWCGCVWDCVGVQICSKERAPLLGEPFDDARELDVSICEHMCVRVHVGVYV